MAFFIVLLGDTIDIWGLAFEEVVPYLLLLIGLRFIGNIFSSLTIFVGLEQNRHLISLEKTVLVSVRQAPYHLEFCLDHSFWKGIVSIDFALVNQAELLEPCNPSGNYLFKAFVHRSQITRDFSCKNLSCQNSLVGPFIKLHFYNVQIFKQYFALLHPLCELGMHTVNLDL